MARKHLMIAVDWFGPYMDLDEARSVARYDYDHGLYFAFGQTPRQRSIVPQYIGIAKSLHTRLHERHHKLQKITRNRVLWLGEIATAEPSGKRLKATRATLDYAEWLHARFLKLPLNEMKTKRLPPRSVTVLNRWFRKDDYVTPYLRRPHAGWPDLIDFPDYDLPARAVWFGSRQRTFLAPDYACEA